MHYEEFEKRYTNEWFSSGWSEIEPTKKGVEKTVVVRKDLATLENELEALKQDIENIKMKKIRLANLAKLYE